MIAGVLLLAAGSAFAEDEAMETEERPAARTLLSLDMLGMLQGTLQLEGEHAVTNWLSVRLGAGFSFYVNRSDALALGGIAPSQLFQVTESRSQGWGVNAEPGLRVFLSGTAPEGLWVGPHLGIRMARMGFENLNGEQPLSASDNRTVTLYGDLLVGYTLMLGKGFQLQAAVGVRTGQSHYTAWSQALNADGELVPVPGGPFRTAQWYTQPATRLAFGWAF